MEGICSHLRPIADLLVARGNQATLGQQQGRPTLLFRDPVNFDELLPDVVLDRRVRRFQSHIPERWQDQGLFCEEHGHYLCWEGPIATPRLCEHLGPIYSLLARQGFRATKVDTFAGWWDLGLNLDRWVSRHALTQVTPIQPPLSFIEDRDYHGPFDSLFCKEHRHCLVWPLLPIADRLKAAREASRLTTAKVADRLGLVQWKVEFWESSTGPVCAIDLNRACWYLGISPDELLAHALTAAEAGALLRSARQERGLTIEELGKLSGAWSAMLADMEDGNSKQLSFLWEIITLARLYACPLNHVLGYNDRYDK